MSSPSAPTPSRRLVATAALLLSVVGCDAAQPPPSVADDGVSFVVFGDQPYAESDVASFPSLVSEVNAVDVPFVIHVGDIKAGSAPCSDSLILHRRDLYRGFQAPVAFTPGDNEWTDCHRAGGVPLERLAFLRDAFYGADGLRRPDGSVGQGDEPGRDAEFVENARWVHENIVFATAHVVGSDNGREAFEGRLPADDDEVRRREAAVTDWVAETFEWAGELGAAAVVITVHADLDFAAAAGGAPIPAFQHVLDPLEAGVRSFDGLVLLLHGDTHSCLLDTPSFGPGTETAPNFVRLRVSGGARQVGWFLVTLRPGSDEPVTVVPRMLRGGCSL